MAMKYGSVDCERYSDFRGGPERIRYALKGGPYLRITGRLMDEIAPTPMLKEGKWITLGPYRFRILEYQPLNDLYLTIQDKWPLWWLAVAWHRINKLPDLFYRRLIVTLAVWKLADYSGATVPYIGDVHLVQKVRKWLTHT